MIQRHRYKALRRQADGTLNQPLTDQFRADSPPERADWTVHMEGGDVVIKDGNGVEQFRERAE